MADAALKLKKGVEYSGNRPVCTTCQRRRLLRTLWCAEPASAGPPRMRGLAARSAGRLRHQADAGFWPFPYHSTDTKALYMPDQLFTVRAAGGTRFPTTLPSFRFQASSTLRPTLELGGWPFFR